ncbi:hypothetical protein EJ110_NYTH32735 [Nymphaea thermarum]|nr:hypothetical protein EJ110_NYTH32735 [Nymphaea thermarum]
MDGFEFDTVKAEKAMAMRKFKRTHHIGKFFRCLEAFLVLFFLFPWFSSRLPAAARASGDYLCLFLHFLASQKVVFLIGNGIVVTLLAKSGLLGRRRLSGDLYDEFIRNSEQTQASRSWEGCDDPPVVPPRAEQGQGEEETVFEDKPVCVVERSQEPHAYRRSLSEKQEATCRKIGRELRRTETEKSMRELNPPLAAWSYDEAYVSVLSSEEFQRTVDAFIAKQIQFQRQESLALVVQSQCD